MVNNNARQLCHNFICGEFDRGTGKRRKDYRLSPLFSERGLKMTRDSFNKYRALDIKRARRFIPDFDTLVEILNCPN